MEVPLGVWMEEPLEVQMEVLLGAWTEERQVVRTEVPLGAWTEEPLGVRTEVREVKVEIRQAASQVEEVGVLRLGKKPT
ncbi:unnamed protein product [Spirodela intermedia]|uniref:Uncharacterized protein n=1 Tax=Spirodela intermedia TaxID=51605 RepID=A0A7I8KA83_SPIIN|nr:unnamed protein product [Spirodela intermedia]